MTVLSSTANSPPGKAPCNQEAPGSIALLHICAARDDTSVPTVSARAPPAGQVAMHPTPDAIRHEQPFHRNSQEGGSQRQPLSSGMLSAAAAAVSRVLSCQVAVSMVSDRGRDEPAGILQAVPLPSHDKPPRRVLAPAARHMGNELDIVVATGHEQF